MTDLASMAPSPQVRVRVSSASSSTGSSSGGGGGGGGDSSNRTKLMVTVSVDKATGSEGLSFFVRLRALDANGKDVLPATWSDNFVTVLSGESLTVELEHEASNAVDRVTATPFNAATPLPSAP